MEYVITGKNPRVLLLAGMHGDEYESGQILDEYIGRNKRRFPHYLFVPRVSPSAVAAKTRLNALGNDINRQFYPSTSDNEALEVMRLLSSCAFELAIDIHEDPDRTRAFYLYDSHTFTKRHASSYRTLVHATGAICYTGVDDIDDENLRRYVERGYISMPIDSLWEQSGFISLWLLKHNITKRVFTLEIPGKADRKLKQSLIHNLVPFLISTFVVE